MNYGLLALFTLLMGLVNGGVLALIYYNLLKMRVYPWQASGAPTGFALVFTLASHMPLTTVILATLIATVCGLAAGFIVTKLFPFRETIKD